MKIWNSVQNLGYHLRERKHKENFQIALTSGFFAPLTKGHVRLIEESSKYGELVVVINGDNALCKKKGFIPQFAEERAEIISKLETVDYVVIYDYDDVSGAILSVQADYFCKGGDEYLSEQDINPRELFACKEVGAVIKFTTGGNKKIASSSDIFNRHLDYLIKNGYKKDT